MKTYKSGYILDSACCHQCGWTLEMGDSAGQISMIVWKYYFSPLYRRIHKLREDLVSAVEHTHDNMRSHICENRSLSVAWIRVSTDPSAGERPWMMDPKYKGRFGLE